MLIHAIVSPLTHIPIHDMLLPVTCSPILHSTSHQPYPQPSISTQMNPQLRITRWHRDITSERCLPRQAWLRAESRITCQSRSIHLNSPPTILHPYLPHRNRRPLAIYCKASLWSERVRNHCRSSPVWIHSRRPTHRECPPISSEHKPSCRCKRRKRRHNDRNSVDKHQYDEAEWRKPRSCSHSSRTDRCQISWVGKDLRRKPGLCLYSPPLLW